MEAALEPVDFHAKRSQHRRSGRAAKQPSAIQEKLAKVLYDHDAMHASVTWLPWEHAVQPKRLRYLARAAAVLMALMIGDACERRAG